MGVAHRRGFSRWLKPLLAGKERHQGEITLRDGQSADTEATTAARDGSTPTRGSPANDANTKASPSGSRKSFAMPPPPSNPSPRSAPLYHAEAFVDAIRRGIMSGCISPTPSSDGR